MTDPTLAAQIEALAERATPGDWQLQDGCSWRRIGTRFHDGDVLCPTNARTDGHPDLIANDGRLYANLKLIVFLHNNLPAIVTALRQAEAYPQHIGDLHLGEDRSDGERMCHESHEVPVGHPLYWPQLIDQYDDSDPRCFEHAIERYADHSSGYPEPLRQAEAAPGVVEALETIAEYDDGFMNDGLSNCQQIARQALARQHGAREEGLAWLAERDNLVLLHSTRDDAWQVRRASSGEVRGQGDTPRAALQAAMIAAAPATDVGER